MRTRASRMIAGELPGMEDGSGGFGARDWHDSQRARSRGIRGRIIARLLALTVTAMLFGGAGAPASAAQTRLLPEWETVMGGPLQYVGYDQSYADDDLETLVLQMAEDHANSYATNIMWARDMLKQDAGPAGWRIATSGEEPRIKTFKAFMGRMEKQGWPVIAGTITCTNFHALPKWFADRNPDSFALDNNGERLPLQLEGPPPEGMACFWPSFEGAQLNRAKQEFVRTVLSEFGQEQGIYSFGMDGESLYAPNVKPGSFTDYSPRAINHFRDWLQLRYGSVERLNELWKSKFKSWAEIEPPKAPCFDRPSLDWHSFRLAVLREYLQGFYAIHKELAPGKPALGWLHDMGFRSDEVLRGGIVPHQLAAVSDGLIGNLIVRPPDMLYNTLYYDALGSFGKVVVSKEYSYFPRPLPAEPIPRLMLECLGEGLWSLQWCEFRWGDGQIDWGIQKTKARPELRRFYGWLEGLRPDLQGFQPAEPATKVYVSEPMWILRNWAPQWRALHASMVSRQIPRTFLFDPQIADRRFWPKCLTVVDANVVPRQALDAVIAYIAEGGVVVLYGMEEAYGPDLPCIGPSTLGGILGEGRPVGQSATLYPAKTGKGALLHFNYSYPDIDRGEARRTDLVTDRVLKELGVNIALPVRAGDSGQQLFLESFRLTDGLNQALVLVNTGADPMEVRVDVDALCGATPPSRVRYAVYGEQFRELPGEKGPARVKLFPGAGGLLLVEGQAPQPPDSADAMAARISGLRGQGYDVAAADVMARRANSATAPLHLRRAALARLSAMTVFKCRQEGGEIQIQEASLASIPSNDAFKHPPTAYLVPLYDFRLPVQTDGPGRYRVSLERAAWPPVRDFVRGRYEPYQGALTCVVSRKEPAASGSTRVTIVPLGHRQMGANR